MITPGSFLADTWLISTWISPVLSSPHPLIVATFFCFQFECWVLVATFREFSFSHILAHSFPVNFEIQLLLQPSAGRFPSMLPGCHGVKLIYNCQMFLSNLLWSFLYSAIIIWCSVHYYSHIIQLRNEVRDQRLSVLFQWVAVQLLNCELIPTYPFKFWTGLVVAVLSCRYYLTTHLERFFFYSGTPVSIYRTASAFC